MYSTYDLALSELRGLVMGMRKQLEICAEDIGYDKAILAIADELFGAK